MKKMPGTWSTTSFRYPRSRTHETFGLPPNMRARMQISADARSGTALDEARAMRRFHRMTDGCYYLPEGESREQAFFAARWQVFREFERKY